jgi:hypothetical protein
MTRKAYHKKTRRPEPVVLPETPDARKAKHLPMFGPGIVISIPLHLWPAYAELYHLGTFRRSYKPGVDLLVKRESERPHAQ